VNSILDKLRDYVLPHLEVQRTIGPTTLVSNSSRPSTKVSFAYLDAPNDIKTKLLHLKLLAYLSQGVDLANFDPQGIIGFRLAAAGRDAALGPVDGEEGISHYLKSALFDTLNDFIREPSPRNLTEGICDRHWKVRGAVGGGNGRPDWELILNGNKVVLLELKPEIVVSDRVLADLVLIVASGRVWIDKTGLPHIPRDLPQVASTSLESVDRLIKQVGVFMPPFCQLLMDWGTHARFGRNSVTTSTLTSSSSPISIIRSSFIERLMIGSMCLDAFHAPISSLLPILALPSSPPSSRFRFSPIRTTYYPLLLPIRPKHLDRLLLGPRRCRRQMCRALRCV